jgi:hypothetical protein
MKRKNKRYLGSFRLFLASCQFVTVKGKNSFEESAIFDEFDQQVEIWHRILVENI